MLHTSFDGVNISELSQVDVQNYRFDLLEAVWNDEIGCLQWHVLQSISATRGSLEDNRFSPPEEGKRLR